MAKKVSKKVSKKVAKKTVVKESAAEPVVGPDERVQCLLIIADNLLGADLGDVDGRFRPTLEKLADSIGAAANRLAKAIDVRQKQRQKDQATRDRLLARAAKYDIPQ